MSWRSGDAACGPPKAVGQVLNGRATDVNNRYIGSYNNGTLSISCRINGKDKDREALVSAPIHNGGREDLYHEDGLPGRSDRAVDQRREGAGSHGRHLLCRPDRPCDPTTTAKFDDVVVGTVSSEPQPAGPIGVKDFGDHQVISAMSGPGRRRGRQRYGGRGRRRVEVCVTEFGGGEVVKDWTAVAENARRRGLVRQHHPASGRLVQAQGPGPGRRGAGARRGRGAHKWGVGINILCIGQSNMVGQAPEAALQPRPTTW